MNENVERSEKASVAKMRAKRASEQRLHYFFSDNFNMENKLENSNNFSRNFRVNCGRSFARSALLSGYLGKSGHLPRCRGHGIFFNKMYRVSEPDRKKRRWRNKSSSCFSVNFLFSQLLSRYLIYYDQYEKCSSDTRALKCEVASTH